MCPVGPAQQARVGRGWAPSARSELVPPASAVVLKRPQGMNRTGPADTRGPMPGLERGQSWCRARTQGVLGGGVRLCRCAAAWPLRAFSRRIGPLGAWVESGFVNARFQLHLQQLLRRRTQLC
jgi:hypothetical protein